MKFDFLKLQMFSLSYTYVIIVVLQLFYCRTLKSNVIGRVFANSSVMSFHTQLNCLLSAFEIFIIISWCVSFYYEQQ